MNKYTVCVGAADAFSAKKRRYSSTAVGFPIRDDLSVYLQGISATFPTWERARLACTYVRDLGICFDWAKKDPLYSRRLTEIHAADNANSSRHGLENPHTAPLFVPACMMGGRTVHHANTTLATPCGASNLSERQCNSLLVGSQLAWELLAILLNSHWPTIRLTLANHSRPIQLILANYSAHIGEPFPTYSTHIRQLFNSYLVSLLSPVNSTHMKQLNVLIACEESQAETMAFRQIGHRAFFCDIKPCRRGTPPEWHIQGNVLPLLDGITHFTTQDGTQHIVDHWDLIIAHPPCTYLCKVGSVWMRHHGILDELETQTLPDNST